jgi:hypothetical protein
MSNLTGELFKQLAGLPSIVHIPYSREPKPPIIKPRDMYVPDLPIDTLRLKARNFR